MLFIKYQAALFTIFYINNLFSMTYIQTVADQLQYLPKWEQEFVLNIIAKVLEGEEIFYEVSIEDLLWGYEDKLLKLLYEIKPSLVPETTFGLFVGVSIINNLLAKLMNFYFYSIGLIYPLLVPGTTIFFNDLCEIKYDGSQNFPTPHQRHTCEIVRMV